MSPTHVDRSRQPEDRRDERPMRVAVIGATGLVGRPTVAAVQEQGHTAVPVARSTGVDVLSGHGLDEVLAGVDAVIDVTNTSATDPADAEAFFGTATRTILAAEERAAVRHHELLSIMGLDRVTGNGHYSGKRRQEELVQAGPVPWTILRATQFFDLAAMVVSWTASDGAAVVPPLLVQPVAVVDVAAALAEVATSPPHRATVDLAGPEPQDFVDMARRTLAARRDRTRLVPSWRGGPFGVEMAGEVLLPGPSARVGVTTFDAWLREQ